MIDRTIQVLMDTMLHKEYVLKSACKMARYFIEQDQPEKAIEIIKRGWVHDNSKFTEEELNQLIYIDDGNAEMRHARKLLPDNMKAYLQLHYQNNTHHPEHWKDVSQMPEMDIVEMCCDWHARSTQFGTDLVEFAKARQENRFHFPPEMFQKILKYCQILVS